MDIKDFLDIYKSVAKEEEFEEYYNDSKIVYEFTLKIVDDIGEFGMKVIEKKFNRITLEEVLSILEQLEIDGINAYGMTMYREGVVINGVNGAFIPD